jgi:hypothetical protein
LYRGDSSDDDVTLVDVQTVQFLAACEAGGGGSVVRWRCVQRSPLAITRIAVVVSVGPYQATRRTRLATTR